MARRVLRAGNPEPGSARTTWRAPQLDDTSSDTAEFGKEPREQAPPAESNLVSSLLEDGRHSPALDIDLPCELRPSSTPGHFHLLVDCPMPWRRYRALLRALMLAGVIERGVYRAAVKRRQTFLRLPHVKKAAR